MGLSPFYLVSLLVLKCSYIAAGSSCFFPLAWHGEYFHLGHSHPLTVVNNSITSKGVCVENMGSQYIMQDYEYGEPCYRCISMYRKHHNVLQYKESYCEAHFDSYASLCMSIAGDSPMYSLFRRNSEPVKCPFKGPFTFSYSKGGTGSVCSYPKSYMDSCTDHSKLQLHFQACIDVKGSESASEELQCIAAWKDGSKSYLVAERNSEHVYSDESRYRCYVFERHGKGANKTIKMAESVMATCTGLWSPTEGYRIFELEKVVGYSHRCEFPDWLTSHHGWSSLDGEINIHINSGEKSFKLTNTRDPINREDSHFICHDIVRESKDQVKIVNYVKSDCDSGYVCSLVTRTYDNVISVQLGHKARIPSEACSDIYFSASSASQLRTVQLVSRSHVSASCSLAGRYSLTPLALAGGTAGGGQIYHPDLARLSQCSRPISLSLTAGCGSSNLGLETVCASHVDADTTAPSAVRGHGDAPGGKNVSRVEFRCHAHWSNRGETRLIISERGRSNRFFCLTYTDKMGAVSSETCDPTAHQFLISQAGPCLQALSSISGGTPTSRSPPAAALYLLIVAWLAASAR